MGAERNDQYELCAAIIFYLKTEDRTVAELTSLLGYNSKSGGPKERIYKCLRAFQAEGLVEDVTPEKLRSGGRTTLWRWVK